MALLCLNKSISNVFYSALLHTIGWNATNYSGSIVTYYIIVIYNIVTYYIILTYWL